MLFLLYIVANNIYNLDETGLNTCSSGKLAYFRRGSKNAHLQSPTAGKTVYTVMVCGNADASHVMPPFVVFKGKLSLRICF